MSIAGEPALAPVQCLATTGQSVQETDHTSMLRFVQARFNLSALSDRDANAQIPFDLFDFDSPPRMTLPNLPTADIEPAFIGHCEDTKTTNFEDEVPVAGTD